MHDVINLPMFHKLINSYTHSTRKEHGNIETYRLFDFATELDARKRIHKLMLQFPSRYVIKSHKLLDVLIA